MRFVLGFSLKIWKCSQWKWKHLQFKGVVDPNNNGQTQYKNFYHCISIFKHNFDFTSDCETWYLEV